MAKENREQVIRKFINDVYTDPTLLSFDILFTESSLLFNTRDSIDGQKVFTSDIANLLNSFEDNAHHVISTPLILFKNLNETKRYKLWKRFATGFPKLFKEQQWRVQSIDGLDSVFTSMLNIKDGYKGSGDDKISITCIEDVELTLYNLFEIYRQCIYDTKYKRQLVPNNLLQFDCNIIISDKRNLVWDTSAPNKRLENFPNSTEKGEEKKQSSLSKFISNARQTAENAKSVLDTLKSSKEKSKKEKYKYDDKAYDKPVVVLQFSKCKFDLSSINKTFESLNPSETDNNWSKYTFSFTYGNVDMISSTVDALAKNDEIEELEFNDPGNTMASLESYNEFISDRKDSVTSMESLINSGWDGALASAKKYGQNYLDGAVDNITNKMDNLVNNVLGQEVGYEVGQNIYGQSNFISAFGEKVGDKISQFADEGINKLKGETVGKLNGLVGKGKAIVGGTLANAESSLMNGGQKGKSPSPNTLKPPKRSEAVNRNPEVEKLTGNERIYEENTSTNSDTFESFNIYQNTPSGPKQ